MTRIIGSAAALAALVVCLGLARPAAAEASVPCSAAGDLSGLAAKACDFLRNPGKLLSVGKNLLTGHLGSVVKSIFGGAGGTGSASTASTTLGLAAIVAWVIAGARFSLGETSDILGRTTSPRLTGSWFSSSYWRIAGIAALLTLPFLFAAAVQALIRSDLALLTHSALGYLPLAMLAVAIAAPVAMLLLSATDQLCAVVSAAARGAGVHPDLSHGAFAGLLLASAGKRAPFILFLLGLLTTAGAVVLWLELAVREAAVYVVVLLLPLAFAALVWPARRVWALRALELLIALILSKLAIVAVLDLGGAAIDQLGHHGAGGLMAAFGGVVLVLLATLAPWATVRLVPLAELASGAAASLRPGALGEAQRFTELRAMLQRGAPADETVAARETTARMSREAQRAGQDPGLAPADAGAEASRLVPQPAGGRAQGHETADHTRPASGPNGGPGPDAARGEAGGGADRDWLPPKSAVLTLGLDERGRPHTWIDDEQPAGAGESGIAGPGRRVIEGPGIGIPGTDADTAGGGHRATGEDHDPLPPSQEGDPLP